ncbi:TonB-dependent receptor [Roseateles violae]|uniref:TonB-dependent receptor n=1 Tax=Roseateles violae TaxID=3058042 RepID=A0ABT8DQW7_9BURK|nr:TonB-dependent receptor [Pelomonas sp. PFR6]MDN3920572.1 TonB-dependent receptor [Pelomonas sp. PFR6]
MRTHNPFASRPSAVGAFLLCWALAASAQQAEKLERVVTTGNPLNSKDLTPVADSLAGDALTLSRGATLGDTLERLPGLAPSYFGPNSNRPAIRGLDGDRVRMLSNSGASLDASSLSFDHAVPIDPLVVERIEVLRGAAALLYGGNAIGGVVNALDNRIPRQAQDGIGGAAELRLGGAQGERSGALVLDGGSAKGFAWHADLAGRRASDQRVPGFVDPDGVTGTRVRNSAADSHGAALGGSLLFAGGYAGVSIDDYHTQYGVTVEPDTTVQMQRQRLATAGEWKDAQAPLLRRLGWQLSGTRYEHRELDGEGHVGTIFDNRGAEMRVEAEHAPLGPLSGVLGLQAERSDFSALGEEALVPGTRTRSAALFLLEQYSAGAWAASAGARAESVRVHSDGDAAGSTERFGPATAREFTPASLSLSGSYKPAPRWSIDANLTHSERAPTFYELFANGVHVASGAYERGDAGLRVERARGLDLGLKWKDEDENLLRLNIYQTRFDGYIALDATGEQIESEGESLPVYAYHAVPALLRGFELEAHWTLPGALRPRGGSLALTAQLDGVRGENRASGEALPRLAPLRATLGLDGSQGPWSGRLEWRLVARQDRVPALDKPTAGYGMVRLSLARQFHFDAADLLWYLRLDNLGDKLAYNASSAATVRGWSPLPGRSLSTGLQMRF